MIKSSKIFRATLNRIELCLLSQIPEKYLSEHAVIMTCAKKALDGSVPFAHKADNSRAMFADMGARPGFHSDFDDAGRRYTLAVIRLGANFLDEVQKQGSSSVLFRSSEPAHQPLLASLHMVKRAQNNVRDLFSRECKAILQASGYYDPKGSVKPTADTEQSLLRDGLSLIALDAPKWHRRLEKFAMAAEPAKNGEFSPALRAAGHRP